LGLPPGSEPFSVYMLCLKWERFGCIAKATVPVYPGKKNNGRCNPFTLDAHISPIGADSFEKPCAAGTF